MVSSASQVSSKHSILVALTLVLAACGSGGGHQPSSAPDGGDGSGGGSGADSGASGGGGTNGSGGAHGGTGGKSASDAGARDGGTMMHDAGGATTPDAGDAASDDEDAGAPDECPNDPHKTEPGVCGCGVVDDDTDTDMDTTPDCIDKCPLDIEKTKPGNCGCGAGESTTDDYDGDGTVDCQDHCYNDPNKTEPGACGCYESDDDTDHDGTLNCNEICDTNPDKTLPGVCGCLNPDDDNDSDGTIDCKDNCVGVMNSDQLDADHDGVGAACDCKDDDDRVYANHLEVCDGVDNDCDTNTDENDPDGDGVTGCNCSWQAGTFSWRDITATGTQILAGADDDAQSIALGFAFDFSGASYTTALVSSNGFVMFGSNSIGNASISMNSELPNTALPNGVIAPFWDDLVNDGDGIWYATSGSTPNRELVVSWLNVKLYTSPPANQPTRVSFQLILHEGGGVELQYNAASDTSPEAAGANASIGLENVNGQQGLSHSYRQSVVSYSSNLQRVCL